MKNILCGPLFLFECFLLKVQYSAYFSLYPLDQSTKLLNPMDVSVKTNSERDDLLKR